MKNFVIPLAVVLISLCTHHLPGAEKPTTLVVTEERVLLDRPSFRANAVTMLSRGEKVHLLEAGAAREKYLNFEEAWYYVRTGPGQKGWIYGAYVRGPSGERMDAGADRDGKPAVEGDIPKTIRMKATPVRFSSREALLASPESARYRYDEYGFSPAEAARLKQSGFYIRSVAHNRLPYVDIDDMVDLYQAFSGIEKPRDVVELTEIDATPSYSLTPVFISSDYLLHLYHLMFMRMVEDIEKKRFLPAIKGLTESLAREALKGYRSSSDPSLKDAYRKAAAFFCVPLAVMGGAAGDAEIESMVAREIGSIRSAAGFGKSAITGKDEDYSQYRPRGHYNKDEALRTYFKVMMWYGRIYFPADSPLPAIIIAGLLSKKEHLQKWESIYIPTSYLVGRSDDLDVYDFQKAMRKVFGSGSLPASAPDEKSMKRFIDHLKSLPAPKIISTRTVSAGKVPAPEESQEMTRGFRFMGQRFIPDSYIFTMFTSPRIGSMDRPRNFPTGLDVMSVLGSAESERLLEKEIAAIPGFSGQYRMIKKEFDGYGEDVFSQNIYWGWLNCIRSLFVKPDAALPAFMERPEWKYRLVLAAHGSWAELRHDTILYAKQSYAEMGGPEPETVYYAGQPRVPRGYVEPNPLFFRRLLALADMTSKKLIAAGVLTDEYREKLGIYGGVLKRLAAIVERQAANAAISDDDFIYIGNCTKTLSGIVLPRGEVFMDDTYKKMAVVADVHTDSFSGQVLEVGVGMPKEIFMYVKDRNGARVCVGFVYSYYEFKAPMSARMTDEEWRQKVYNPAGQKYLKQREPSWMKLIPSAD